MIRTNKQVEFKEFILISAVTEDTRQTDNWLTCNLEDYLSSWDFDYKRVIGRYNSNEELSLYVEVDSYDDVKLIRSLAQQFKQESILHVDKFRQSTLLFIDESLEDINLGEFKQVPEAFAKLHEAYTFDTVNGGYYICKNTALKRV